MKEYRIICQQCGSAHVALTGKAKFCSAKCGQKFSNKKRYAPKPPVTNLIGEIWKDVIGYEGLYMVSCYGRVKSMPKSWVAMKGIKYEKKERILRPIIHKNGYAVVGLHNNNTKVKVKSIHRIVAESFIPNAKNKEQVNHIDGNKINNHIENLEWATRSENMAHAYRSGLAKISEENKKALFNVHAKKVVDTPTGVVYDSVYLAAVAHGINPKTLHCYLIGKRKNKTTLEYLSERMLSKL